VRAPCLIYILHGASRLVGARLERKAGGSRGGLPARPSPSIGTCAPLPLHEMALRTAGCPPSAPQLLRAVLARPQAGVAFDFPVSVFHTADFKRRPR